MQIVKQFLYGKWTVVTVVTLFFLNFSRVLGARIMRAGIMRTYLRSTREKFTFFSVTTVTVQKNKNRWWGWVEDVSQSIHAYRIRAVRVMSLYLILHPPPPYTQCTTVSGTFVFIEKKWAPPPFNSRILCI